MEQREVLTVHALSVLSCLNRGKGLTIERNRGVKKMKDQEWDEKPGKG